MPSSLTWGRSRALDFSSCLRVSVSGTVRCGLALDSVSRHLDYVRFASTFSPLAVTARLKGSFSRLLSALPLGPGIPPPGRISPHASCPRNRSRYRIVDRFPIGCAFRPRLRGRLTPGRLPLPGNPQAFGGRESHPSFRYLCLHSLFHPLQRPSQARLLWYMECSPTARSFTLRTRGFGTALSPVTLSARACSTSELLRTLSRNGCF